MEILNQFGVDIKLLIAQMVNFAILLIVLKFVLYKPILKMLEDRKNRIKEAEENANSIEERLEKIEQEREKVMSKVSQEATQILEEATKNASDIIAESHVKASEDIKLLISKAKDQIKQDQENMRSQMREELANVLETALTTIYSKKLTKSDQEEILKQTLKSN